MSCCVCATRNVSRVLHNSCSVSCLDLFILAMRLIIVISISFKTDDFHFILVRWKVGEVWAAFVPFGSVPCRAINSYNCNYRQINPKIVQSYWVLSVACCSILQKIFNSTLYGFVDTYRALEVKYRRKKNTTVYVYGSLLKARNANKQLKNRETE